MSALRTAAQQALEALRHGVKRLNHRGGTVECLPLHEAITDLRAALAEPEYPLGQASTDVGVPVYVVKKAEPQKPCNKSCAPGYCYCDPVQEPVAWMYSDDHERILKTETFCTVYSVKVGSPDKGVTDVPLYTHQPQRKPLTEDEIQQCFKEAGITIVGEAWTKAIRAIERAHGIT